MTARSHAKLQRWIDLLAALLGRNYPADFAELVPAVPEYAARQREIDAEPDTKRRATKHESLKRTFERDKQELRVFGIPLVSESDEQGNESGRYRLDRKSFYLPYLSLVAPAGPARAPKRVDKYGYKALATLSLAPDELSAIVDAASVVRGLGDPLLAADVDRALRKLAVDLPVDAFNGGAEPVMVLPRARPGNETFECVADALSRRKILRFAYHALSTDAVEPREVEPYGVFLLNGHWYLAARDRARNELRNFRLNRMADVAVETARPLSPDFEVPPGFRLREHAASRHAWEIGDSDAMVAVVQLREPTGEAVAAMALGRALAGNSECREFDVRRVDTFVRWLLSMAGAVVPVSPPECVSAFDAQVDAIAELYARDRSAEAVPECAPKVEAAHAADTRPWQSDNAAQQLARILQLVPEIADGNHHPITEVAARLGIDFRTLSRDLHSLGERYDVPAGFVDGVGLYMDSESVWAVSSHLLRPMRLTASELCALRLGLSVLRSRRTPAEYGAIERASGKLSSVVARLPGDDMPVHAYEATTSSARGGAVLDVLREGLRAQRTIALSYRKSGATRAERRVVRPYRLAESSGMLYLIAGPESGEGVRVFRFDRMDGAELLTDTFEPVPDAELASAMRDGRVFQGEPAERMVVRYGPRIARWIAEREGRAISASGELVLHHPLADAEWGVRHVLQYGADAEILAPEGLRMRMRERLAGIAADQGVRALETGVALNV